ncbi:MAG: Rpn family recombination-promoting nuclease/putative transposase [Treponema sp.]
MKKKSRLTKHSKKGQPKKNRQFKDSVFVYLFSRDEKTRRTASISLYNALHEEKISDDAELKFIELKNVLYHKEKNDVSFMVNGKIIVLVEHQSTVNENMPLRFLMYIVAIYQLLLDVSSRYKERLFKIPSPEFYVIYNGQKERPAIEELKLSDAFMECGAKAPLELIVKVININHPDNKEFLAKCELLEGYKQFGDVMSDFIARYGEKGYDLGISYCIEHGILKDFLSRHIKEVLNMLKAKYSYKDEIRVRMQEAREEGWESGLAKGIERERGEVVKAMKSKGFSTKDIADILNIKEEIVESM